MARTNLDFLAWLPDGIGSGLRRRITDAESKREEARRLEQEARALRKEAHQMELSVLRDVEAQWTKAEIREAREIANSPTLKRMLSE